MKMKRYLFLCFVVIFFMYNCVSTGSNKVIPKNIIQPDLTELIESASDDQLIRIIIRLKDQFPEKERNAILAKEPNREKSRKTLINSLRSFSRKTQGSILDKLRSVEKRGSAANIRSFWISNVITLDAKKSTIFELEKFKEIKYIKQDIKRPALQQNPAWGVDQINADTVWATSGLTGSGIVVGVIDTGIDVDHPDLVNNLWINAGEDINNDGQFTTADNNNVDDDGNGYIDDVLGWDFGNNDNTVDSFHNHGVHVSGTVAGDGTGGVDTGVAPGVEIMTLSYSASILTGQAEAWDAMQYAFDNGADIVNFSSGWKDSWNPDYETWRDNTDVLVDGGVLFVVAAGNDDPHVAAPGDVLTPARCPGAFAVGATDNTDAIAAFSSQGPSSWIGVNNYDDYIHPPGLLKPDVSAPGVSINSTVDGGGYANSPVWSGTSMAAPHTAGLAALLMENNPALRPHELAYIIKETAVDIGAAGPDNTFGYGRIDAQAAVNHNYTSAPVYDLSVTGTNSVWTSVDIWVDNNNDGTPDDPVANSDNNLYARVRNLEGEAVGNVEMKFYYADVGTIGTSGFDPNNDGDPSDGNFIYIDSYFVPVIGPAGSTQDVAIGVVNWNVPVPTTDHWCVGIGIVAHNPPNDPEVNRTNNIAFKNFFDITILYNQILTFDFMVYPDFRKPGEQFELQLIRKNLPEEFKVMIVMENEIGREWLKNTSGLKGWRHGDLKELKYNQKDALQRNEKVYDYAILAEQMGVFKNIRAPKAKPVRMKLIIQAPGRKEADALLATNNEERMLIINAADEKGAFGGLTLNIHLSVK